MKSFLFVLITFVAAVDLPLEPPMARAATESRVEEQMARAVSESHGLHGSRDPIDMSPKESACEANIHICQVLNTVFPPNVMTCECANDAFDFECTAAQPRCIDVPNLGSVCTMTRISGSLRLLFYLLATEVTIRACGVQNTVQAADSSFPIVDVCAHVNTTLGIDGIGITSCGVGFGNRICNSCSNCQRGNSTGLSFSCGRPIDFCLPINIPIFVDKPAPKSTTLEEVLNLQAWDNAAMALVTIDAEQQYRRRIEAN